MFVRAVLAAVAGLLWTVEAAAQPLLPHLRIIAPAAPGGGWDQTARAMQQALQAAGLVGTSSVENISGAAGTIGLARFASAERGNSDVLMASGLIMLGGVVTHHSPITLRDVTPIARLTGEYEVLVVPRDSRYRTLHDLLEAFRAHPEAISWGGGSAGGTDQILAGLLADAIGVQPRRVNYIAFAGGGESMSAILGGQVHAGINGLGEFAPHIAAGAVRVLGISSAERLPALDAPTFREQGVDVVLENWRSLVAPPAIADADRQRLIALVTALVQSSAWRETLERFRWNDRFLAGDAFARFTAAEETRVEAILMKLGTGTAADAATMGRYPLFVLVGLSATALATLRHGIRRRRTLGRASPNATQPPSGTSHVRRAFVLLAAVTLHTLLLERAGFILAATPLFWLTAHALDARHPIRDAAVAFIFSVSSYYVFARLLQIQLPAGVWTAWL